MHEPAVLVLDLLFAAYLIRLCTFVLQACPFFPELFNSLDKHLAELGIANYGISVTTLEEVFFRFLSWCVLYMRCWCLFTAYLNVPFCALNFVCRVGFGEQLEGVRPHSWALYWSVGQCVLFFVMIT